MLQKKYYKMIRVSYADSSLFRITNVSDQPGTLTITKGGGTLKYSLDGVDFTNYDFTTHPTISVPAGANVYMKGAITRESSDTKQLRFSMDVNNTIGGNILSIIDENNYTTMTTLPNNALGHMFNGNTHLISAGDLNFGQVTTFGDNVLWATFKGCPITATPDFSNITTIGYDCMYEAFQGCTALSVAPDLSSISSIGSEGMRQIFSGCTSLTTVYAPNVSTWDTSKMSNWLYGVAANGTLYCPSQAVSDIIPSGNNGCPSGWTKVVL